MDVLILMVYDKCPVDVSRLTWYGFDVLRSTMYGLYAVLVLIQHNAVSYRHPALHAYTHRAFFASKERPKTFDVIHSISTFDHDGLGRYGDPLDPDGDLRSMKEAHKFCGRGGGCNDTSRNDTSRNWRYPSHGTRLYGMHTVCTAALFSASSSRVGKWSSGWAFIRRCSTSLSRTRNSRC
jgi:hypothetical protein